MNPETGIIYTPAQAYAAPAPERAKLVEMTILPTVPQLVRGRVGRNEPCPCSSGKKFKKCCLVRA